MVGVCNIDIYLMEVIKSQEYNIQPLHGYITEKHYESFSRDQVHPMVQTLSIHDILR